MASSKKAKRNEADAIWRGLAPRLPMTNAERACNIGDLLQVVARLDLLGTMEDPTPSVVEPSGQIYKASGLVDRGWDLTLVSGDGPEEIRMLNHYVKDFFRVLPKAP